MFTRIKRVAQNDKVYEYVLLVETVRHGHKVRQHTVANLGRRDLLDPERIDAMILALGGLSKDALVLSLPDETNGLQETLTLGALPVFRRLWHDLGLEAALQVAGQASEMPIAEAAFCLVAARLMAPKSKRATFRQWLSTIYAPEFSGLELHHLYRAVDLLHLHKDEIEKTLWNRNQELFAPELDLVLMDTTNIYFYGPTLGTLAQFGPSKEKQYHRRLVSIGLLATRDGVPIGHEVFPGNMSDVDAFRAMLSALKTRFKIRRVIICADRGMVSAEILKELRQDGIEYIVGARPSNAVEDAISYTGANWQPVDGLKIRVKPMGDDAETYVVCYNPDEAEHDRQRRKEIVARLRRNLRENPSAKSLLRNSSFKSYVQLGNAKVEIDEEKIRQAARYDGKYVLRSNANLAPVEIAKAYRQLYRVERAFREVKGPLKIRPVYHFTDRRIRGHIMVCFLAYALGMALRQALAKGSHGVGSEGDYHEIMQDLGHLGVGKIVTADGRTYFQRTPLRGRAYEAFAAVGLRPPSTVLAWSSPKAKGKV